MNEKDWEFLRAKMIPSIRNDRDRAILERAAKAYGAYERSGEVGERLIAALGEAVRSASQTVRAAGAACVWELARGRAEVGRLLVEWFDGGTAAVRLSIVQSIAFGWGEQCDEPQVELEGVVIERGLQDRSAKVRVFAADRAKTRGRMDLVPRMDAAVAAEGDAKVRASLEYSRDLLRDGYRRSPEWDDESSYEIGVRFRSPTGQGTVGIRVPRAVADAVGFAEVARRIRVRKERPGVYRGEAWEELKEE